MGKGFSCVGKRLPGCRQKRHAQDGLRVPQGEGACRAVEDQAAQMRAPLVVAELAGQVDALKILGEPSFKMLAAVVLLSLIHIYLDVKTW